MKILVGSYGTPTRPLQSAVEFDSLTTDVIALDGVDGLEIPYMGSGSRWQTLPYLQGRPGSHALTMIPAMMSGLEQQPALGLASTDEESRQAALAIVREGRRFTDEVNAATGGAIDTVQLHSSPGGRSSSVEAFARSFDEIDSWGWDGVAFAIEHCDAYSAAHVPAKGFLPLDDELRVAAEHGAGIVINWGRSVIETRSAEGAAEHIAAARAAGLLTGVIFSGCTAVESAYGVPWGDRHVPIRGWSDGALGRAAEASLLTAEELDRCVKNALGAPELQYLGVKVKAPAEAVSDQWVEVIAGNVAPLRRAIDEYGADR